jgi:peroxiredoxin
MNRILQLSVGVLIVALMALIIFLDRKIAETGRLSAETEQLKHERDDLLPVRTFREAEILLNGKKLSKEAEITDDKGNSIELNEIMNSSKLVFYFSETSCDMCVDMEIARLNEKADLTVSDNTVILISAISKRYVSQYKSNNKLRFPVYEIKSRNETFLPSFLPCYFIIDNDSKRINSSFFPSKYTPDETDRYLNKIAEDYFRQETPIPSK